MQHTNIALRISLGFALLAFLLPFASVSVFMFGSQSASGLSMAFGGENMNGGRRPPELLILLPLILLVLAFVLSLGKKPLGRWIGAIPLVPFLIFSLLVSHSGGNGFAELRWGLGIYFSLLASLAASIIGFMGRVLPNNQTPFAHSHTSNSLETLPPDAKDPKMIQKVLNARRLMVVSVILLLVNFFVGLFGESSLVAFVTVSLALAAIVIGITAFLRVSAVLGYEITTRVVVSILIILPLINLITLIVLVVKVSSHLKSLGLHVGLFDTRTADFS